MKSCDTPGLISVEQALAQLLDHAKAPLDSETLPLTEALGRVLAQGINSTLNVPPFDCSAMDGYAIRCADVQREGTHLPLSQRIAAGVVATPLHPGSAARIFTGAPMPAGADCVVIQENCTVTDDGVIFNTIGKQGDNIRYSGCHLRVGQLILEAGTRLQPQHLGVAASVGMAQLPLFCRVKVALLSTGSELAAPGQPLQGGQIYNSNHYMLKTLLQQLQCEVVDLGTIADDLALTTETLRRAADECDLIISSGGVSVGEEDHIKTAITTLGRLDLWRLNIKPGKPLAFAHVGNTPLIGLPGNPVSSFVTFCLLARPFILKSQGMSKLLPKPLLVKADYTQHQADNRREYLRACLHQDDDGQLYATPLPNQDSATLLSLTSAEGLLCIPDGRATQPGDLLKFFSLASLMA